MSVSGIAEMVPGFADSASCRPHQAASIGVWDNRRKYARRDSAAAAHKRGMAAKPRGVFIGTSAFEASETLFVRVGVWGFAALP